jgi:tRNA 2-selenouridine synthase
MSARLDTEDFSSVLLRGVPLLDVRAPIEFAQGAFPSSVNLPLMSDEERHRVGLHYKKAGQDAAIVLGHTLVSGDTKEQRVAQWVQFAQDHPEGYLYCFRGGLRSRISQQWLAEAGLPYPRIIGGYKAMRSFLIEKLAQSITSSKFMLIAGFTGCGKTEVIQQLTSTIDLEKLAHHRGSSFGKHATDQPVQIDFDNSLAIAFMRLHAAGKFNIALEDESRLIGKCALPIPLRDIMQFSPVIWIEEPTESRVERILHDYVEDLGGQFARKLGAEAGFEAFSQRLLESLQNLYKRLGGERHVRLNQRMLEALALQKATGALDAHRNWIRPLLTEYYDPMYEHQRAGKASRIIFSGDRETVTRHLKQQGY